MKKTYFVESIIPGIFKKDRNITSRKMLNDGKAFETFEEALEYTHSCLIDLIKTQSNIFQKDGFTSCYIHEIKYIISNAFDFDDVYVIHFNALLDGWFYLCREIIDDNNYAFEIIEGGKTKEFVVIKNTICKLDYMEE